MRLRTRYFVMIVCWVGCLMVLTSCFSYLGDREQGFNMIQRGFSNLEPTPGMHEEIVLKRVKVVIVGSRDQFQWKKATAEGSSIIGYATPKNEIWVFGKRLNGKIVINEAIIGHELVHLLNFKNPAVANPDKLSELSALHDPK